jgi:hypothetical protein
MMGSPASGALSLRCRDPQGWADHTVPIAFSSRTGMDVGRDNGLVVALAYEDRAPHAFTGTVKKVVFDLTPGHVCRGDGPARAPCCGAAGPRSGRLRAPLRGQVFRGPGRLQRVDGVGQDQADESQRQA